MQFFVAMFHCVASTSLLSVCSLLQSRLQNDLLHVKWKMIPIQLSLLCCLLRSTVQRLAMSAECTQYILDSKLQLL